VNCKILVKTQKLASNTFKRLPVIPHHKKTETPLTAVQSHHEEV
jgi:hypothetical protein